MSPLLALLLASALAVTLPMMAKKYWHLLITTLVAAAAFFGSFHLSTLDAGSWAVSFLPIVALFALPSLLIGLGLGIAGVRYEQNR